MTRLNSAKQGVTTPDMIVVARDEGLDPETIRAGVAAGRVVIPKNAGRNFRPRGIGAGLRTKVNANIGTSNVSSEMAGEIEKLQVAIAAGADSVMDLSTGGDLKAIRRHILDHAPVMVGSVPIYRVASALLREGKTIGDMTPDALFDTIEAECREGIDYITVHCGVTRRCLSLVDSRNRLTGIVSRGGSLLAAWMYHTGDENPLYTRFDRLLRIAEAHDVTLSLGDGLRPGAIADATDAAQLQELTILGELTRRARDAGVQVMVEGPGHVPLDQIRSNVQVQKRLCDGAPFYVLGPLATDCAPGYDHITGAIGGALAAAEGADFLCYVTPAEHLCLPTLEDVRLGVISARIAAHCGDIAKGIPGAAERDAAMSGFRKSLDWEGMFRTAIDPQLPRRRRSDTVAVAGSRVCTMCGDLCAVRQHSALTDAGEERTP